MKNILKYITIALALPLGGVGGGLLTSCSPETENVFGQSPAKRQQQAAAQYLQVLEAQELGWAVDFYPGAFEYGGIAYTARFRDGQVTLACEQPIANRSVDRNYAAYEEVTSGYQIINGNSVMLTFDTYNALIHYWSQPSGTDYDGYASDYEFTFVSASADEVLLRGVRYGNLLHMYALKEPSRDYLTKVSAMRSQLSTVTRKRLVADGTSMPITALENHMEYTAGDKTVSMPYIYTPTGLRFYEPVTLGGVEAQSLDYNAANESLASADGRMQLPQPTMLEKFCGATTQWHFVFGRNDADYDMCDDLRTLFKQTASVLNREKFETIDDMYIGLNKLSRDQDTQRFVMGWDAYYLSIGYNVCHGIDIYVDSEQAGTIAIKATDYGNLYYNYTLFAPLLNFVVDNSPYVVSFSDTDQLSSVRLTSQRDATKWFTLKRK